MAGKLKWQIVDSGETMIGIDGHPNAQRFWSNLAPSGFTQVGQLRCCAPGPSLGAWKPARIAAGYKVESSHVRAVRVKNGRRRK
jgi:hypothetical protein